MNPTTDSIPNALKVPSVDRIISTLVTGNPGKIAEFSLLLGYQVSGANLKVPEYQPEKSTEEKMRRGSLLQDRQGIEYYLSAGADISSDKAKAAFALNANKPAIIEDTCLFIDCKEGFPGPLIRFETSPVGLFYLCQAVNNPAPEAPQTRRAVAVVTLAAWNGSSAKAQMWQGFVEGLIAQMPRGTNGFGWDPIFIPIGSDKTFAEMTSEEKAQFSMRRMAVDRLKGEPFRIG